MAGVFKAVDSADFFVQARDETAALITAVATNGGTSPVSSDKANTLHRGVALYVAFSSITVNTATLAISINGKNSVDGLYYTVAHVSLDGLTVGSSGNYGFSFYPGQNVTFPNGNLPGPVTAPCVLPATFQIQTSLTVTTTASMSGTITYSVKGMSRLL